MIVARWSRPSARYFSVVAFVAKPVNGLQSTPPLNVVSLAAREARQVQHPTRWLTTTSSATEPNKPELVYEGPLSALILRLKGFSLFSTFLSTIGMPLMIAYKGVDMYSAAQYGLVTTTIIGSMGSTLGLHYIFGPYVQRLERFTTTTTPLPDSASETKTEEVDGAIGKEGQQEIMMLRALTKTIFLTSKEIVFNPQTDTVIYSGARPFCSIHAHGQPLYLHRELIEDKELHKSLFLQKSPIKKAANPDPDDDFL